MPGTRTPACEHLLAQRCAARRHTHTLPQQTPASPHVHATDRTAEATMAFLACDLAAGGGLGCLTWVGRFRW
eukprot:285604-Rhodomonas_salina.1